MKEIGFRNRIHWMSFFLCALVVGVHSQNAELFALTEESGLGARLLIHFQEFIALGLGQIAVPGFFMISAYLFYRNFSFSKLFSKWKSRIFSILVPFVVWNVLYYGLYCLMSSLPFLSRISDVDGVVISASELWSAIVNYSYNPVFWYLFQLILLIVSAPFLYAFLHQRILGLLFLGAAWMAVALQIQIGLLNADALVYYATAAYAALHARNLVETAFGKKGLLLGVACVVISILPQLLFPFFLFPVPVVLLRLGVPTGLWMIGKEVPVPKVRGWMKGTFFVYATHFLIVRSLNKIAVLWFEGSVLAAFLLYIIDIVAAFALAELGRRILGRYLPFFWKLISGGRY